jgi:hypothetical protein
MSQHVLAVEVTDAEAKEIANRASAATKGPFIVEGSTISRWCDVRYGKDYMGNLATTYASRADAELLAHARDDLERLLADRDRLKGLLDDVMEDLARRGG